MITVNDKQVRRYYKGSEILDGVFPLGTIGYGCFIEDAIYRGDSLFIKVNSGLPERRLQPLLGSAAESFMQDMDVSNPSELRGRRVSVILNEAEGVELISRR